MTDQEHRIIAAGVSQHLDALHRCSSGVVTIVRALPADASSIAKLRASPQFQELVKATTAADEWLRVTSARLGFTHDATGAEPGQEVARA